MRVTARWMRADPREPCDGGLPVAVCATAGTRALLIARLPAVAAARALAAARRGETPQLTVAAGAALELPAGFDEPLALLAVDLAVARAALEDAVLPAAPATVVLDGYGPLTALLHAEIAARGLAIGVRAVDRAPLRRAVAAALGADVRRAHGRRSGELLVHAQPGRAPAGAAELDLSGRPQPRAAELAAAIAAIAAAPSRYRPLLTAAASARAGDAGPDPAAEIAAAVLL